MNTAMLSAIPIVDATGCETAVASVPDINYIVDAPTESAPIQFKTPFDESCAFNIVSLTLAPVATHTVINSGA